MISGRESAGADALIVSNPIAAQVGLIILPYHFLHA